MQVNGWYIAESLFREYVKWFSWKADMPVNDVTNVFLLWHNSLLMIGLLLRKIDGVSIENTSRCQRGAYENLDTCEEELWRYRTSGWLGWRVKSFAKWLRWLWHIFRLRQHLCANGYFAEHVKSSSLRL